MNSSYSSYCSCAVHAILHIVLVQFILLFISSWCKILARQEIESILPPSSSDDLCLLFCLNPSSMGLLVLTRKTCFCFSKSMQSMEASSSSCRPFTPRPPSKSQPRSSHYVQTLVNSFFRVESKQMVTSIELLGASFTVSYSPTVLHCYKSKQHFRN